MDIEVKKSLIAAILQTETEEILEAIKSLLKIEDQADFWDQLSGEDQEAINEGIRQLDEGKSVSYEEAKDLLTERLNFKNLEIGFNSPCPLQVTLVKTFFHYPI